MRNVPHSDTVTVLWIKLCGLYECIHGTQAKRLIIIVERNFRMLPCWMVDAFAWLFEIRAMFQHLQCNRHDDRHHNKMNETNKKESEPIT